MPCATTKRFANNTLQVTHNCLLLHSSRLTPLHLNPRMGNAKHRIYHLSEIFSSLKISENSQFSFFLVSFRKPEFLLFYSFAEKGGKRKRKRKSPNLLPPSENHR
ncbi:hypothetical protein RJT34_10371 [Clitoria ternatea]|uniref:Uncharacterized protein n=1 Tax=Clitoria ternatea TaxID=43366 RepID=A0AAN9K8I9_CLITE